MQSGPRPEADCCRLAPPSVRKPAGGPDSAVYIMEGMGGPRDRPHFTPTPLDSLLTAAGRALRSLFAPPQASRAVPPAVQQPAAELSEAERRLSAALMRVNHAGEIAAQ